MAVHSWNNHKIEIKSKAIVKHLWTTIRLSVMVDDTDLFQSPKHIEGFKTVVPFTIKSDHVSNCEVVSLRPASLLFTRYKIIIDGAEIDRGKVVAKNWYLLYGLMFLLIALAAYFFT